MKYLKIVLAMVLLVAFVFATADAAKSPRANTASTLQVPKALVGKVTPQQWQQMLREQQTRDPEQPYVAPTPAPARLAKAATLSGDINVGIAYPSYTSIRAAVATLIRNGGVGAGGVRFLLTDPVYAESSAVLVSGIAGTSAANPLVFQPAAGNTSCLVKGPADVTNNGFFEIKTQSFVTIEGVPAGGTPGVTPQALTIRLAEPLSPVPTNRFTGSVRVIQSQNVTISDVKIIGAFDPTKAKSFDAISTSSGGTRALCLDNFLVKYCILSHGRYGIDMSSATPFPSDSNVVFQYNKFGSAFAAALGLSAGDYTDGLTNNAIITGDCMYTDISHNVINGILLPSQLTLEATTNTRRLAGIYATFATHTKIYDNVVMNVKYGRTDNTLSSGGRTFGIQLGGNSALVGEAPGVNAIYNNAVSHIQSDMHFAAGTFYGCIGIFAGFDNNVKIWHNSVWLSDTVCYNSYNFGIAFYGTAQDGAGVYLENNAVENTQISTGHELGIFCFGDADVNFTNQPAYNDENHNDYYYTGTVALSSDGSPLGTWNLLTGFGGQSVFGDPNFVSTNDLHQGVGASYAYHIGMVLPGPFGPITQDLDGLARNAPAPTAGAYENGTTAAVDLATASVAGGYMHGTAVGAPVNLTVILKNNGSAAASANLHVTISDGYNKTVPVNVPGMSFQTVTLSGANMWAPAATGVNAITASHNLAGDINHANDTAVNNEYVFPVDNGVKYITTFESAAEQAGWLGLGDWQLGTPLKLAGPHSGTKAWATQLASGSTYSGAEHIVSMLFTPYFNFANNPHPKVSFWQDMATEPSWDASVFQYTTDLGATWHVLGSLAAPKGQNWYGGLYRNSAGDLNCFANYQNPPDDGTVFPDPDHPANPYPKWTSNGDCEGADTVTGPTGYVQVQLIADQVGGQPFVQFRYLANPDASGDFPGWLFDDFEIHPATTVSGAVWNDANDDTFRQGTEPGISAATVTATPNDTTMYALSAVSDANGLYSLALLNGDYVLTVAGPAGTVTKPLSGNYAFTVVKNPGNPYANFDFGFYSPATVSGKVYNDVNHDGLFEVGEPGIAGVTINVTGAVNASGVTAGTGAYSIAVNLSAAGSYTVSQVVPAGDIQLTPAGNYSVGLTPGGTVSGKDFGDGGAAVGQLFRTASYEDWALAGGTKNALVACKPNQVQYKYQLQVPQGATGIMLGKLKGGNAVVTRNNKLDTLGAVVDLSGGGDVSFANALPPVNPGDIIQVDGFVVGAKKQVKINYGWDGVDKKASRLVEVWLLNNPRLPMPNLANVGAEIFSQLLRPVYFSLGKVKLTSWKSTIGSLNAKGTLHVGGVTCVPLTKVVSILKPGKPNSILFAEMLTLELNILASDLGKFPAGFGDLIYDDQQNPTDPWNGMTIRNILAVCDTFFACLDTPKGSDGNVYYTVLHRLNHDSFRDSTNLDTTFWSCQKITMNGAKSLLDVPFLQANPNPVTIPVAMKPVSLYNLPATYSLRQNYPNPFNPSTTIEFSLPQDGIVTLKIYNVLGQEVATLINNATMDAGTYPVDFNAGNLASGIYFYRLTVQTTNEDGAVTSQSFSQVKKMLLMK